MRTILITGGAGFIGSHFIKWLFENFDDLHVVNYDALTYASNRDGLKHFESTDRYTFAKGDIRSAATLAGIINTHNPDVIVNFAAHTHVDRSINSPHEFINTNITGTHVLLDETNKWLKRNDRSFKHSTFKLIHVSTDEVYGSTTLDKPFTEESRYNPSSPYAASKASSDHLVRAYGRTHRLPFIITNCSNNYGPNQFPEKLIPLMILNGLEKKKLPIYGSGDNVRDWIFVGDHCSALWQVIWRGRIGDSYNIGANHPIANEQVVLMICDLLDETDEYDCGSHRALIEYVTDRPGHDEAYVIANTKIKKLGWCPHVAFKDGLRQTFNWYRENLEWVKRIHDRRRLGVKP